MYGPCNKLALNNYCVCSMLGGPIIPIHLKLHATLSYTEKLHRVSCIVASGCSNANHSSVFSMLCVVGIVWSGYNHDCCSGLSAKSVMDW